MIFDPSMPSGLSRGWIPNPPRSASFHSRRRPCALPARRPALRGPSESALARPSGRRRPVQITDFERRGTLDR